MNERSTYSKKEENSWLAGSMKRLKKRRGNSAAIFEVEGENLPGRQAVEFRAKRSMEE
ncbi:MAG: hypothetical protein ACYS4W_03340 [Planctomycetota bacterium]|jgi:hypothetical protein